MKKKEYRSLRTRQPISIRAEKFSANSFYKSIRGTGAWILPVLGLVPAVLVVGALGIFGASPMLKNDISIDLDSVGADYISDLESVEVHLDRTSEGVVLGGVNERSDDNPKPKQIPRAREGAIPNPPMSWTVN